MDIASNLDIHINVVGYHGRKGPKEDPTVMGSAVQYMSIESYCPTLIIKDPALRKDRPGGYRFGCCVDGSKKSYEALEFIRKVRGPEDPISVIICE